MKFKLLFVVLILLFSCDQEKKSNLTIATAANMKFAMKELVKEFQRETGIVIFKKFALLYYM